MKITMKQVITGLRDGVAWPAIGDTIVVPDDEGALLCSQGAAEPVAEPAKAEKRDAAPAKKTAAKKG